MICFHVRKKIYEYVTGELSGDAARDIQAHFKSCSTCDRSYQEIKRMLDLAAEKRAPELSEEFWSDFDRELDSRLNEIVETPRREIRLRPRYQVPLSIRPAFALVTVAVMAVVTSIYLFGGLPTSQRIASLNDERLINDIEVLEELTGEYVALEDQEFLLDEMLLVDELS